VRAGPNAFDDFLAADQRALKNDRQDQKAVIALDPPQQRHSIHPRHGAIEQDAVVAVRIRIEHGPAVDTVDGEVDAESVLAQMGLEQRPIRLVVFNDQDPGLLSHRDLWMLYGWADSKAKRRRRLRPVGVGAV